MAQYNILMVTETRGVVILGRPGQVSQCPLLNTNDEIRKQNKKKSIEFNFDSFFFFNFVQHNIFHFSDLAAPSPHMLLP